MGVPLNPFPISQASFQAGVPYYYTELLSDGDDVITRSGSVAAGNVWKRGTILNLTPAGATGTIGVLALPSGAGLESQCNCILAQDIDTSATGLNGPGTALVYVHGKFKVDAITWPATGVHGLIDQSLRFAGLFLESVVPNTGGPLAAPFGAVLNADQLNAEAKRLHEEAKRLEDQAKTLEGQSKRTEEEAKKADADAKKAEADEAKAAKDAEKAGVAHHDAPKEHEPNKGKPPAGEHHR